MSYNAAFGGPSLLGGEASGRALAKWALFHLTTSRRERHGLLRGSLPGTRPAPRVGVRCVLGLGGRELLGYRTVSPLVALSPGGKNLERSRRGCLLGLALASAAACGQGAA